jgi:hypothetical protein
MAQIFISHSKDDNEGKAFLEPYFAASRTNAFFYGWHGPKPPHAPALREQIRNSVAMIVLMSDHLTKSFHTAAWTSYEVGLAHAYSRPIIHLEAIPQGYSTFQSWPERLPVANIDYLFYYTPTNTDKIPELQEIIDSASGPGFIPPLIPTLNKHCKEQVQCALETCKAPIRIPTRDWGGYICPVCRIVNVFQEG